MIYPFCVLVFKKKRNFNKLLGDKITFSTNLFAKFQVKTCRTIKFAMNARFKSKALVAKQIEKHLFEDPRVLWGIKGATPNSSNLPEDKKEN